MSRMSERPELPEREAAWAIYDLAQSIQDLCYYTDPRAVPPATTRELHKCYRVLKPTVIFYLGEDHGLPWDAPDYKFQKKVK